MLFLEATILNFETRFGKKLDFKFFSLDTATLNKHIIFYITNLPQYQAAHRFSLHVRGVQMLCHVDQNHLSQKNIEFLKQFKRNYFMTFFPA